MLHVCRRFFSSNIKDITLDTKTKKIVERFFKENDKNGEIRKALKKGQKEIKELKKKRKKK